MKTIWRFLKLALLVASLMVLSSCGGGGGSSTSTSTSTTQAGIVLTSISDTTVPVIAVAADKNWKERLTLVGSKDATGTPVNLSEVHYSVLGIDIKIELNADGLPSVVSDQAGNKYTLTNYTSSTVDITYFDQFGGHIVGPTTIPLDATKLATLKSTIASLRQKPVQVGALSDLSWRDWIGWSGNTVDIGICVTGAAYLIVGTVGAATPLAIAGAALCAATTAVSAYTLVHDVQIPQTTIAFGVASAANIGAELLQGHVGGVIANSASLLLSVPEIASSVASLTSDAPPTIPTNLGVVPLLSAIQISWSEKDSGISGYKIIRDNNIVFNSGTAFYEDTTAVSGVNYCYQVIAIGLKHESDKSASQCATISTIAPPLVITGSATNITQTSVTLNGSVNPDGAVTNAHFEYGTSTTYGNQTQLITAMNGTSFISLTENLSNLSPNTTYHYRVVAMNSEGSITTGSDQTFQSVVPVTAAPTISNISPVTVTGSNSAQPFTINGSNFVTGANITLRDKSTGEVFPNRQPTSFTNSSITLSPVFSTTPATWSVNVVNPDNSSTGEHVFSVVAPTGGTLGFSSLSPSLVNANAIGYQPTLTVSGSNFSNLKQISFNWSGVTSGNSTWINGDINWLRKVIVNSDGSMTLKPVVTQTGDPAGTTNWTVTLLDSSGASLVQSFTVNYQPTTTTTVTIPATPASPSPGYTTSPGPTTSSSTVGLSWSPVSGATYYGLGVRDIATNTLVVDTTLSGTSYSAGLAAGKQYRWNVAACNSAGCSTYTTVLYFQTPSATTTVTIPATPASPSPGYTTSPGPTTSSSVVGFSWSPVSGATYYGFAVRNIATGVLVVDTTLTGTSYSASLAAATQYRWNVAACNSAGCSSYTTVLYFRTP
jgi:hypothetical protein